MPLLLRNGLLLENSSNSIIFLTRFDRNVCAAGLNSIWSNGVWPAGFVLECDHNLLSYLCFDYWTYRGKETPCFHESFLGIKKKQKKTWWKMTEREAKLTKNSQMLLVGLSFFLNSKAVIGVFPIHHLLITRANSVFPSLHKYIAWTGRHAPI